MLLTPHAFDVAAESVGFASSIALSWQSFRLVRHLRAVRDLRRVEERRQGQKLGELAGEDADKLEKTIGRWDARDQWLVVVGLAARSIIPPEACRSYPRLSHFRVEQSVEHRGTIYKIFLRLIIELTPESPPKNRDCRGRHSP